MPLIPLKLQRLASLLGFENHIFYFLTMELIFWAKSLTPLLGTLKAYGGGGSPSSSSFIIRMDEYNQWLSVRSS